MTAPLADHDARVRITTDFSRTLFIEAAAGTGKTHSLIERIVGMIAGGAVTIDQVAAITFTEAAAAELRDRLRRGLEGRADGDDEPAARCRAALRGLDDAAVSTLHSFAQRLLAEYPLEAGLPPTFEVVDDMTATVSFTEAWRACEDALLDDPDLTETLTRGLAVGLSLARVRDLAEELHRHWDRLAAARLPECAMPPVDVEAVLSPLRRACDLLPSCTDDTDGMAAHLDAMAGLIERLGVAAENDEITLLAALADAGKVASSAGRQGNWPNGSKGEVVAALAEAQEALDAVVHGTRQAVLCTLLSRLVAFVLDEAKRRRSEGSLEFHDLLVLTRDLLRDRPDVATRVAARFRVLHVDEFQDTDPLQIEIAALLAHEAERAATSWADAEVGAGRLVMVGDPKQSIYRFRRADIGLYDTVRDRFDDAVERLTTNFRSDPSIIEWVNHVFSRLMGEGRHGVQAAYVGMHAHRAGGDDAPRVRRLGDMWPKATSLSAIRTVEADEIARAIGEARGRALVATADGGARPAEFADMAILVPTRRTLPQLERALEAAWVPYRVEARSLIFATQEVRDLVNLLRAIDDPGDQISLFAALRGPAFGATDRELLEYRRAGGAWSPLAPAPADLDRTHPVVAAMATLAGMHEEARWASVSEVVDTAIARRRFMEGAFAHRRPRDVWRRLQFVADQARAFADAGGASLREFVDWLGRQAEEGVTVNEAVVPEPDDDAVRILTVHGSKGLEFPLVFLTGLNVAVQPRGDAVLFGPDGALEARAGANPPGWATDGYTDLAASERAAQEAEAVRLLYVAATRARDLLVVSTHHREGHACPAAAVVDAAGDADTLWAPLVLGASPPVQGASAGVTPVDRAAEESDRERWVADRRERIERLSRAPVASATALAHEARAADGDDGEAEAEAAPWKRGRAGTALGRAVHAVLQTADLATGAGIDEVALAQADAEGIPDRVDEVRRMARAAVESRAVQEAVASGRMWRELYVAAPVGDTVVEGYLDLLYEGPDGLVVVDYKTDRVDPRDVEDALARYRIQGAAYAAGLEAALDRPVARCVFVFAGVTPALEREVTDLPAAVAEVRALVGTPAA